VEVTRTLLERIDRLDAGLHSYVTVLPDSALAQAAKAESELARGDVRSPLHGVPLGIKDLCATKGVRTTCGTTVLSDWIPDHDATVVERLADAGAVILGKLKLTEGAFAEHHPDVAAPVNPWNAERWTGVSSSGSGVATAAGLCYGSLGTDTGGSIRYPSACNGIVGIKPTYGRVSRYGVFPLSVSLDHVGPMTRSTADAAALLEVIAGFDPRDPTSRREPTVRYGARLDAGIRGVRIGIDEHYCTESVDAQVSEAALACADEFRKLGAETRSITLPPIDRLLRDWTPFTAVEAALAHRETFPAQADRYGPALRGLLEAGLRVTGTEYARIQSERETFRGRLAEIFEEVDLILCPSVISPPPPLALMKALVDDSELLAPALKFTAPFDFSGSPTLSVPNGFTEDGLPLSLQLVARHLDEELLCRAGFAYEQATEWHSRHPPL
jgi:amidase